MSEQAVVYEAVRERGYLDGYEPDALLFRQLLKLTEELGEAWAHVNSRSSGSLRAAAYMRSAAEEARHEFDKRDELSGYVHVQTQIDELASELADLQVVLFVAAQIIAQETGQPFDIVQAAVDKAEADVKRGVR